MPSVEQFSSTKPEIPHFLFKQTPTWTVLCSKNEHFRRVFGQQAQQLIYEADLRILMQSYPQKSEKYSSYSIFIFKFQMETQQKKAVFRPIQSLFHPLLSFSFRKSTILNDLIKFPIVFASIDPALWAILHTKPIQSPYF